VRDHLHLQRGDRLAFAFVADRALLRPATRKITDLKAFLPRPAKPVSLEVMGAAIRRRATQRR
jgi:hypothetical protein